MKKIYLTLIVILLTNLTFANDNFVQVQDVTQAPPTPTTFQSRENDGAGGYGSTPIDDYAEVLIITALTIAGAIYYNKEKLSIKNK